MPIATVNGNDLNYELGGNADRPVLMFANSLGTDMGMWQPQMDAFAGDYRILRYDMRGHGQTEASQGPYTIDLLAGDALALIRHLGLSGVNFCGLSMGGMVGQWLGAHAGDYLNRLILCATSATSPNPAAFEARIKAVEEQGLPGIVDAVLDRWFTPQFQKRAPQTVKRIGQMTADASPQGYVACCEALVTLDISGDLRAIGTPTLCIVGADDMATPVEANRYIADHIAGARLEIINEGAHLINLEQPEKFNDLLRGFLEQP